MNTMTPVISQALPVPTASPGIADIVGFGTKGVFILRNSVNLQPLDVIGNFGYDEGGWRIERHVRLLGDTTGNRFTDVIGCGEEGVYVSINNGNNSFQDPQLVLRDFAYGAGGWRIEKHLRFVADMRKSGRVDIIGFGDAGIMMSMNNNGKYDNAKLALADFGYNSGWRLDKHLRCLADTTGDRLLDVIGFGEKHVFIGCNNGDGTFKDAKPVLDDFCISAGGWKLDRHHRVVADLTGDGKVDILGFGESGIYVSLNNGNGTFGKVKKVIDDMSYAQGWRVDKHPRVVADLTGMKRGDIVGFGDAGVYTCLNNGDGTFQKPKLVMKDFGYTAGGWRMDKHLRFMADLTGDGCADIVGFGEKSVWVAYNDGKGNFSKIQRLTDAFAYRGGQWAMDKTVRYLTNLRI